MRGCKNKYSNQPNFDPKAHPITLAHRHCSNNTTKSLTQLIPLKHPRKPVMYNLNVTNNHIKLSTHKALDMTIPFNPLLKKFNIDENSSARERVDTFKHLVTMYLDKKISTRMFSGTVGNLYFPKYISEIESYDPAADWLMYFAADLDFFKSTRKKFNHYDMTMRHLKLYKESPEKFKAWWEKNIKPLPHPY